jgi:hypothetical protein
MSDDLGQNKKIAGRIENLRGRSTRENSDPKNDRTTQIDNVLQLTRPRPHKWGSAIRELINKSIEIFEAGPKQT